MSANLAVAVLHAAAGAVAGWPPGPLSATREPRPA